MSGSIKQVAVIGSGVMGSQIAAHITNAGIPVLLLDIVLPNNADRNFLAKTALEKLQKADPAPFMHPKNAKLISVGNLDDDLEKLKDVDWIIEAVLENPQVKSDLYKKIDAVRRVGSIISSNTSTIPLDVLTGGQSEGFAKDFMITHFFNPPRYMRLLEIVTGAKTRSDSAMLIRDFCDRVLGKGVVVCKDTPGFIANRLGTFFIQSAVNTAFDLGMTVEEVDAVCGRPMGLPKTGVFGLMDLVGLDLMPLIAKSLLGSLPPQDMYRGIYRDEPMFQKMIADGYTGRKGKGGFYRLTTTIDANNVTSKVKESLDLKTGEYHHSVKPRLSALDVAGKNLRALCEGNDKVNRFAWTVLSQTLSYAASLVPEIADDIVSVDTAMRLGYNWKYGPFELMDRIGASWMATRLISENRPVPEMLKLVGEGKFYRIANAQMEYFATDASYKKVERAAGVLMLSDIKLMGKPVAKNGSASLWNIGDGILCLEFTSKMNAIDPDTLTMVKKSVEIIEADKAQYKGLVIYNDGENFSVGANLGLAMFALNVAMYGAIDNLIAQGQGAYHALRFASFPTVAAPAGMALGGGCEITLHCAATQAHAETYIGLVEVGVGIIPGWGGCAQMLGRAFNMKKRFGGFIPPISQVFETISMAKTSKSAAQAQELLYMRPSDGITMNRDRLLFDAKRRVLDLVKDYKAPEPWKYNLPKTAGITALNLAIESFRLMGKATPHDVTVSKSLGTVLSGGEGFDLLTPMSEAQILDLEKREFMHLIHTPETMARIEHMLNTSKPLRN